MFPFVVVVYVSTSVVNKEEYIWNEQTYLSLLSDETAGGDRCVFIHCFIHSFIV